MKRSSLIFTALAVSLFLSVMPVLAQRGGGGGRGGGAGGGMGQGASGMGSRDTRGGPNTETGRPTGTRQDSGTSMETGRKTPGELLTQNTQLNSKLQSLLPPGTDTQAAASGFKNLGQFVAAMHVSKNLGIPFDDLKAKMTGSNAVSLGKAIHEIQPSVNAKEAAKEANRQAKQDIAGSNPPES